MRTKLKIRAYQKQWRETNKKYIQNYMKEYGKEYYLSNKDRLKPIRKKWEEENKESRWAIKRRYHDLNKERVNKASAVFRKKYPELSNQILKKYRGTIKGKFNSTSCGARRRGLNFTLSLDQFEKLISNLCSYCGEGNGYIGIDRIDNTKGYIEENVCSCCTLCNMMKKTLAKDQFLNHCEKITNFNKTK